MIKKLSKEQKNRRAFSYAELDKLCVKILMANLQPVLFSSLRSNDAIDIEEKKMLMGKALKNLCHVANGLRKGSKTKIRNRCLLTNRGKSVYKKWGVSRNKMHEMLKFGIIPGSRKAVW